MGKPGSDQGSSAKDKLQEKKDQLKDKMGGYDEGMMINSRNSSLRDKLWDDDKIPGEQKDKLKDKMEDKMKDNLKDKMEDTSGKRPLKPGLGKEEPDKGVDRGGSG